MIRRGFVKDAVGMALIVIGAYIVIGDIFKPGILLRFDHPTHLVEMELLVNTFLPKFGWVDGWSMSMPLGQPTLLYTYQLGGWLIAALDLIFRVDLVMAYKILVFVSYVFAPLALYVMVSDRFGRTAGMVSASCFLLQKVHTDLLLSCLWNSYFVIGFFVVYVHLLLKKWRDLSLRDIGALAILQAAIIVGHPIGHFASMLFAVSLVAAVWALHRNEAAVVVRTALRVAAIVIFGSLVAGYHLYNLVVTRSWLVSFVEPWLKGDLGSVMIVLKSIFGGFATVHTGQAVVDVCATAACNAPEAVRSLAGVVGACVAVRAVRRRENTVFFTALFVFSAITFFVFIGAWHYIPIFKHLPLIGTMINKRLLVYLHLTLSIMAGYAVGAAVKDGAWDNIRTLLKALGSALFVMAAASQMIVVGQERLIETTATAEGYRPYASVWGYLAERGTGQSRVLVQSTYENVPGEALNYSHAVSLAVMEGLPLVATTGVGNHFPTYRYASTSSGELLGIPLTAWNAGEFIARLHAFNIRYVVVRNGPAQDLLSKIPLMEARRQEGPLTVFEYGGCKAKYAELGEWQGDATVASMSDERMRIVGRTDMPNNQCVVKVAFHPYWHARVNGNDAAIFPTEYGMMKIPLPRAGDFDIDLVYRSRLAVPIAVSCASLVFCVAISILPAGLFGLRKRKR